MIEYFISISHKLRGRSKKKNDVSALSSLLQVMQYNLLAQAIFDGFDKFINLVAPVTFAITLKLNQLNNLIQNVCFNILSNLLLLKSDFSFLVDKP